MSRRRPIPSFFSHIHNLNCFLSSSSLFFWETVCARIGRIGNLGGAVAAAVGLRVSQNAVVCACALGVARGCCSSQTRGGGAVAAVGETGAVWRGWESEKGADAADALGTHGGASGVAAVACGS